MQQAIINKVQRTVEEWEEGVSEPKHTLMNNWIDDILRGGVQNPDEVGYELHGWSLNCTIDVYCAVYKLILPNLILICYALFNGYSYV